MKEENRKGNIIKMKKEKNNKEYFTELSMVVDTPPQVGAYRSYAPSLLQIINTQYLEVKHLSVGEPVQSISQYLRIWV